MNIFPENFISTHKHYSVVAIQHCVLKNVT